MFRRDFSKPGSTLQLSSTVYWYQVEPHAPLPAMPPAAQRAPAPEEPFWPDKEKLPRLRLSEPRRQTPPALRPPRQGAHLCRERLWRRRSRRAMPGAVGGCRFITPALAAEQAEIELTVPKAATGLVRVYVIDPDNFEGGRKEKLSVAGDRLGRDREFPGRQMARTSRRRQANR